MVHEPEAREAGLLGGARDGGELGGRRGRMAGPVEAGDLQAEAERHRILLLAERRLRRGEEGGRDERHGTGAVDSGEPLGGERVAGRQGLRLAHLARDDLRRDRARALAVAPAHDGGGRVEHDGVGRHPVALGDRAPGVAAAALEAGRVDDGRQAAPQAPLDDQVEDVEGVLARADVALAGADDGAQAVGRDDLVGVEPVGRPVRLARRGRADEDDEARVRQAQRRPVERRLGHPAFSGPRPDRAPLDRALLAWP